MIMIILKILRGICIGALMWCILMLAKNSNTYKNLSIIANAIHEYNVYGIQNNTGDYVDYDNMKSYEKVLYNLFDWGYKNILPPEDFEKIKPFIK